MDIVILVEASEKVPLKVLQLRNICSFDKFLCMKPFPCGKSEFKTGEPGASCHIVFKSVEKPILGCLNSR